MDTIQFGKLRVAFQRRGEGPPLLLLHGALADSRVWRRQLEGLSDQFTVVAWDAPGCGRSSDPPQTFRLPDYADCLAALIQELGLNRPHVLGLSFGGGLALELYRRHPQIPATLVLASAYAGWAGSLPPEEVERRLSQVLRESQLPPEQVIPNWLPGLFTASAREEVVREASLIISDFHPAGMRVMAHSFAEADLRGVLPSIHVPTLLLYGESDQRSPLPVARALHAAIPASQLVVLPGVGHVSNLEAPDAFNAAVRSFLSAHLDASHASARLDARGARAQIVPESQPFPTNPSRP